MTITENELAAFADGQMAPADALRVEQELAVDPVLAERLAAHQALKARLAGHFSPILAQDPPVRLTALLRPSDTVVDLASQREERAGRARLPRWTWIAGPALAASLLIAVFVPEAGNAPAGYADAQLATVLDQQLVAEQDPQAETRVLLSFEREGGDYCRTYASAAESGIACREAQGWVIVERAGGAPTGRGDYQQAGSSVEDLLARAQDMALGSALDARAERAARERGWRN
ncbi:MAG: hypothetical protein V4647_10195 [Pseudomonadota bacterium]